MKFLIDNALSLLVAQSFYEAGFDAVHLRSLNLQAEADSVIFKRALEENWILVSADTDFGTLLALWEHAKPSVILFQRGTERKPQQQVKLILANLPPIREALEMGSVVVFEQNRIRIRALPFSA
jgi:predicted nuclease of predicted toxin-antitoxin system